MAETGPGSTSSQIALIANDAGGALYLAKYLKQSRLFDNVRFFLTGPALEVFRREFKHRLSDLDKQLAKANDIEGHYELVLTGSGWSSDYEINGLKFARDYQIKSITFLDHWTNYLRRFSRQGEVFLPNQFWVFDEEAYQIANTEFAGRSVLIEQKNDPILEELRQLSKTHNIREKEQVLYITEPISRSGVMGYSHLDALISERQAFSKFAEIAIRTFHDCEVVVRVHPSEDTYLYSSFIDEHNLKAQISKQENPLIDILESKFVVGLESVMLSWAARIGKETFTVLPINGRNCLLPDFGIKRLSHV